MLSYLLVSVFCYYQNMLVRIVSTLQILRLPELQNIKCVINCFHTLLVCFEDCSVMNNGSEGPYLVNLLEVPKLIQKVLEYVRKPELAIWE